VPEDPRSPSGDRWGEKEKKARGGGKKRNLEGRFKKKEAWSGNERGKGASRVRERKLLSVTEKKRRPSRPSGREGKGVPYKGKGRELKARKGGGRFSSEVQKVPPSSKRGGETGGEKVLGGKPF